MAIFNIEEGDWLLNAVGVEFEILWLEITNRTARGVSDNYIYRDQISVYTDNVIRLLRLGLLDTSRTLRRLFLFLCETNRSQCETE